MQKLNFSYISFRQNLIATVLSEQPAEGAIFIFPTEKSKRAAIREFQKSWQFSNTVFLTMEELKDDLFPGQYPLLKEEKRTLAFYASLSKEDKEELKINSYFQCIELAHNFFDLWQEFNEEMLDDRIDESLLSFQNLDLADWQIAMVKRLLKVKSQYKAFIRKKRFDDTIFAFKKHKMDPRLLHDFQKLVFVNQFYYTKLEKAIIQSAAEWGLEVTICYQLPHRLVDEEKLDIKDFDLQHLFPQQTQHVNIMECKSDFAMMTRLFETIEKDKISNVVDAAVSHNSYGHFLNFATFQSSQSENFNKSSIFKYFAALYALLNSLLWEPSHKKILIPLQNVMQAIVNAELFHSLFPGFEAIEQLREEALDVLAALADANYKYIDLDLQCLKTFSAKNAAPVLHALTRLLKRMHKITNITSLVDFIDAPDGIKIRDILSEKERDYSEVMDSFYRHLSDFKAIEDTGLVKEWDSIFASERTPLHDFRLAAGILRLFLDYMKPKRIRYIYKLPSSGRIQITNLLDTRNIHYEKIAVLNVIEGQVPHARQIPFLFTEKQRKLLHLKTYDDVVQREKYYFFRLLLTSSTVYLFTQKNIEKNVESSSFLEEVKLFFPKEKISFSRVPDQYYQNVYLNFLSTDSSYQTNVEQTRDASFYRIPLLINEDLADRQLNLTYYAMKDLLRNPFAFYIQWLGGVRERTTDIDEEFSPSLIGTLVHDILSRVWNILEESTAAAIFGYDFSEIDQEIVQKAIYAILEKQPDYYYKIPHNYTHIYFMHVVKPIIEEGVRGFFQFLHHLKLSKKNLKILPEREYSSTEENKYKTFLPPISNPLNLQIGIRGRTDLRIEDQDNQIHYIFDYKTGGYSAEQLIIYEFFYYLIEKPGLVDVVKSYFYHVLEGEGKELQDFYRYGRKKKLTKTEILDAFKNSLLESLSALNENGFSLPVNRSNLNVLPEITRRDLYLSLKPKQAPLKQLKDV